MLTSLVQVTSMLLTDQLLLKYQRCDRQAFLEVHGSPEAKMQVSDFILKLGQDRKRLQAELLQKEQVVRPDYSYQDWDTGAAKTLELMKQGMPFIQSGVLRHRVSDDITLIGTPDLLVKQSGVSSFGDWHYVPVDIKISKRPKTEYQILNAFHAHLLTHAQGIAPEVSWLYLREKGWYAVDLDRVSPQMLLLVEHLSDLVLQQQEPEVFISRNRCSLCPWFNHCYSVAQDQNHLSLLPGVTPTRYPVLQATQFDTVEKLATHEPAYLNSRTGLGMETSRKLVTQAQAFFYQQAVLLPEELCHLNLATFPESPVELYFDIEAEPSLNLACLHGVLVRDRIRRTERFYPFLAEQPEDEAQAWQQVLQLMLHYPDAPIFHFCAYEVQAVRQLAARYGTPQEWIAPLIPRFVDLHLWVTGTVALPIESYTLKLIARWMGFEWRNTEANGAQAICWYSDWLDTGDRNLLDKIVEYNEDDCRATLHVKDWLGTFLAQQLTDPLSAIACGF
jgi:predicted RecB family nuclease